jgi:hypothetical protein
LGFLDFFDRCRTEVVVNDRAAGRVRDRKAQNRELPPVHGCIPSVFNPVKEKMSLGATMKERRKKGKALVFRVS